MPTRITHQRPDLTAIQHPKLNPFRILTQPQIPPKITTPPHPTSTTITNVPKLIHPHPQTPFISIPDGPMLKPTPIHKLPSILTKPTPTPITTFHHMSNNPLPGLPVKPTLGKTQALCIKTYLPNWKRSQPSVD
jgi:hypothetical protein